METTNRKHIDLNLLSYYDNKIKDYVDDKVGTGGLTIDTELSDTSKNPVQNKVISKEIKGGKAVSGANSYTFGDSVDYPVIALNLYGKSVQDGTPTPDNPVDIGSVGDVGAVEITACGKNLLNPTLQTTTENGVTCTNNGDGTYTLNGTATANVVFYLSRNIDFLGQAKLIGIPKDNIDGICLLQYTSWGGSEYFVDRGNGVICTHINNTNNPLTRFVISINKDTICNNAVFKPMITTDLTATYDDYEPYKGNTTSITSSLPLCGIPVTSGGNYTDSNGQQWICDELVYNADGTGKIVKRTGKIIFDGSEDWSKSGITEIDRYILRNISTKKGIRITAGLCNTYIVDTSETHNTELGKILLYPTYYDQISINFAEYGTSTVETFKDYLKNNPIVLCTDLIEPQEIELTAAEMSALKVLQTFDGTTSISNNSGAEMSVKYCTNKALSEYVLPVMDSKADSSHTHDVATTNTNGFMSAEDKTKLDNISANTTKVEASTTNGNIKINGTETTVYTHPSGTNPHGTTKSDVGLGYVPNVATNDQTPSYTEATSLTKLTSGEKLSAAFGKISKAITDLIAHIGDSVKHITSTERTNWNAAKTHADSAHAPSNAQANQNAFSNIAVGSTTVAADTATDTLTLVGNNVTLTPDATNDKVTIGITKANVTSALGYTPPTTDTWRGVVDNLTSTDATKSLSANQGKVLKGLIDGKAASAHTHDAMTGASDSADGTSGLVPAPTIDDINKFLRGDGTWGLPDSSGGEGYQMPYFIQSGTLTVDETAYSGVSVTFPLSYKSVPIVMLSGSTFGGSQKNPIVTSYMDVTKEDFKIFAFRMANIPQPLNQSGTVNWVTLGVLEELEITSQPTDASVAVGKTAAFNVAASGSGLSYQWQYSLDKGVTWKNTTAKTASYSTTASASINGNMYRCVITDVIGRSVITNTVTLTVFTEPKITSATVNGNNVTLEWESEPNAVLYRVVYVLNGKKTIALDTKETSCTVSGLEAEQTYGFYVTVYVYGAWRGYTDDYTYITIPAV